MPTVYIWRPHGKDNPYGHVALATDKYYVSFWTAQVLESDDNDSDEEIQEESKAKRLKRKLTDLLSAVGVFKGHRGGLVLHQDLDKEYESEQDPVEYQIDATVTDEDVNSIYEDFLRFNGMDREDVTLARGEQLYKTRKEYEQLPPEEARLKVEEPEVPQKSLAKTGYSFSAELVTCKEEDYSVPFYHKQQSCVSFIFNLVQTAWLKHHPDQPIPILFKTPGVLIAPNIVRNNESGDMGEYAYEVPWFEEQVVQNYLLDPDTLLQHPAIGAFKICIGVVARPFKLFFPVIFTVSFLCRYFPWLVGFPLFVFLFYSYGCQLNSIFRLDWQQIRELLSIPLNYWMLFSILLLYYGNLFLTLYDMYEIVVFLLDDTNIEFVFFLFPPLWSLVCILEEKLSLVEKIDEAFTPLTYLWVVWKKGLGMIWNREISPLPSIPFFVEHTNDDV